MDKQFNNWKIAVFVVASFWRCSDCLLNKMRDCRSIDQGPFFFKKIDSQTYQCIRDGPMYDCPEGWSIPDWYESGQSDPCLCYELQERGRVCPRDPLAGQRTTVDPMTTTPMSGTISDNGCPSPFQRYSETLRIYEHDDGKEFPLTSDLVFLTPEDECKYHCLTVGPCTGVTYSVQDDEPICIGFFDKPNSYDFRGTDHHVYFEKVWCITDPPIMPTPPPIQNGLLLQNTMQSPEAKYAFLTGVSELSCYAWCFYEPSCAAVDYNKITYTCYYYRSTSCSTHQPAVDHCCNHYKKNVSQC